MNAAEAMTSGLRSLERDFSRVEAQVSWNVYTDKSFETIQQGLAISRLSLDYLGGELREAVLSGARPYSDWADLAQAVNLDLAQLGGYSAGNSIVTLLADSTAAAAEGVANLGKGISSSLPWAALLAVAVALLFVVPRRLPA